MSDDTPPKGTALIAEPSRSVSAFIVETVERQGLQAQVVDSAAEAVAALPYSHPRLMVCTHALPDLDGFGLAAGLRASERHANIYSVVLSANAVLPRSEHGSSPDLVLPKTRDAILNDLGDFISLVGVGRSPAWNAERRLSASVLVADDDRVTRTVLQRTLQSAGVDVTAVDDGRAAVRAASKQSFELILLDIEMPTVNGWRAIQRIRHMGNDTPAIAVTGHRASDLLHRAHEAGFDSVLVKPVDRDTLLSRCARYIS